MDGIGMSLMFGYLLVESKIYYLEEFMALSQEDARKEDIVHTSKKYKGKKRKPRR